MEISMQRLRKKEARARKRMKEVDEKRFLLTMQVEEAQEKQCRPDPLLRVKFISGEEFFLRFSLQMWLKIHGMFGFSDPKNPEKQWPFLAQEIASIKGDVSPEEIRAQVNLDLWELGRRVRRFFCEKTENKR